GTLTQGGSDNALIYQAHSDSLRPTSDLILPVQYTPDLGYTVSKNGVTQASSSVVTTYPTQGWADIADSSGQGIEIGIYQMAAYWPKSLEFNSGGSDVRVGIWPGANSVPFYQSWQQLSSHTIFLNFHTAALTSTAASNAFLSFQHYLVARAPFTYYNTANV